MTTYVLSKGQTFTSIELLTLIPLDVKKWMAFCVFGTEDPSPADDPFT